jgi:hypothetical protein
MAESDQQADAEADQSDRVKPWTIKGIPPEARNAAIAAAGREKQPIGEWLARAIRAQVQSDRQADRAPVPIQPSDPATGLDTIERMIAMARSLAEASGAPPPKQVQRLAYGLLRDRLQGMRGPTKRSESKTKAEVQSD